VRLSARGGGGIRVALHGSRASLSRGKGGIG